MDLAEHSIPVHLHNPGQVLACLGFLDAADTLYGGAQDWSIAGGFDWSNGCGTSSFIIQSSGGINPFACVLEFLAHANKAQAILPNKNWRPKKDYREGKPNETEHERKSREQRLKKLDDWLSRQHTSDGFPKKWPDDVSSLPVRLVGGASQAVTLNHWADGSTAREDFKLYAGQLKSYVIVDAMLSGVRQGKRTETKGVKQLWKESSSEILRDPFAAVTPMKGSFKFDARGAWAAIDAGYSPDAQGHKVVSSPIVEIMAAWGLQNARPKKDGRRVRYTVWAPLLPPALARAAFGGGFQTTAQRRFCFALGGSGKNKTFAFAQEERP